MYCSILDYCIKDLPFSCSTVPACAPGIGDASVPADIGMESAHCSSRSIPDVECVARFEMIAIDEWYEYFAHQILKLRPLEAVRVAANPLRRALSELVLWQGLRRCPNAPRDPTSHPREASREHLCVHTHEGCRERLVCSHQIGDPNSVGS